MVPGGASEPKCWGLKVWTDVRKRRFLSPHTLAIEEFRVGKKLGKGGEALGFDRGNKKRSRRGRKAFLC